MSRRAELAALAADGRLALAPVGGGATPSRWRALAQLARADVSLARLAEAHVDGHQILHEAGRQHPAGRLLGVWASEAPERAVTVTPVGGQLSLGGSKGFCTGAGIVDDALVTAAGPHGTLLVLVPGDLLTADRVDTSGWAAHALADTCTAVVDLDGLVLDTDAVIGPPGWYLERPGFWHGAVGPAACWAGAATGLVDHALARPPDSPHGRAHLGAMVAAAWALEAVLDAAGRATDDAPDDAAGARRRALVVRHLVDEHCRDVQDRFARALGPRPLVADAAVVERYEALTLYRRQCHAERDLEVLGAQPS